ncbi:hypothetical protein FA95DRAFT_1566993 [Auriscalpium vulgare]|uniref:Uncharacterized protein n=1 Tax=Auriscalpium vulgare TaxID=40419 RepID=A0ACB8R6Y5_9AGAM|nr:hypothetical protein FA95DRAFT_1566993 [Auriscalpium vulgare]
MLLAGQAPRASPRRSAHLRTPVRPSHSVAPPRPPVVSFTTSGLRLHDVLALAEGLDAVWTPDLGLHTLRLHIRLVRSSRPHQYTVPQSAALLRPRTPKCFRGHPRSTSSPYAQAATYGTRENRRPATTRVSQLHTVLCRRCSTRDACRRVFATQAGAAPPPTERQPGGSYTTAPLLLPGPQARGAHAL